MDPIMLFLYTFLGVLVVIAVVAIITILVSIYETRYFKNHPIKTIFLGKLSCNSAGNVNDCTKYLKLTNSIKNGIF